MTKKDLIEKAALAMGVSKRAGEMAIEAIFGAIKEQMSVPGNEVILRGFGTFKSRLVPSRPGRNPKTGETIEIPERRKVTFKPSKVM